jgi:hypothetical protein
MNLSKAIESFNSGHFENDLKSIFNNVRSFLTLVMRKGRQSELDLGNISYSDYDSDSKLFDFLYENKFMDSLEYNDLPDEIKNLFLYRWVSEDSNSALKYICDSLLSDVTMRSDGFYLFLSDREELAQFFDDSGRDVTAKDVAKSSLSEEGLDYDRYWDTVDDIYNDVIGELNEVNLGYLENYILKNIGDVDLNVEDYSSDFFDELSDEQNREGFFRITSENVKSLIKDSEAMNELLDGDLDDLKSELFNIHSNAYNSAYESEIYNLVYDGLTEFFSSKIIDEEIKTGDKTKWYSYIKISDFEGNVEKFLYENKNSGYYNTLDYYGGYTEMMRSLFDVSVYDAIDFRIPDYPDYRLIYKYINEYFGDYI